MSLNATRSSVSCVLTCCGYSLTGSRTGHDPPFGARIYTKPQHYIIAVAGDRMSGFDDLLRALTPNQRQRSGTTKHQQVIGQSPLPAQPVPGAYCSCTFPTCNGALTLLTGRTPSLQLQTRTCRHLVHAVSRYLYPHGRFARACRSTSTTTVQGRLISSCYLAPSCAIRTSHHDLFCIACMPLGAAGSKPDTPTCDNFSSFWNPVAPSAGASRTTGSMLLVSEARSAAS